MTLLNVKAKNHPQQIRMRGVMDEADDRRTPDELWQQLHERFGFTVDVAASVDNARTVRFFDEESDGLSHRWGFAERVWCNPPFSDLVAWVSKAWKEMAGGCATVVMLVPANRTEQRWWQAWIEPYRDKPGAEYGPHGEYLHGSVTLTCEFLPGRLRFKRPGWVKPAKGDRPPFGCALLVWRRGA